MGIAGKPPALLTLSLEARAGVVAQVGGFDAYACPPSLEKGIATQSSILAWKIPWTEEPGWL